MPILANLSRRFQMLTTDAKPDPPRINIHDNSPDNNSSSTSDLNRTSASVPSEIDNISHTGNSDDHRKTQNNLSDNETTFSNSANDGGKKPNARTKKKTHSGQAKNIVNYNIVNSNGVKIGETVTYVCNVNQYGKNEYKTNDNNDSTSTQPKTKEMSESVKILSMSKKELTIRDMFLIKIHIDNNWREIFKSLGYSKGQLDQFEETHKSKGMDEMIYQILLDWKRENGTDAQIGLFVKVLWEHCQYDCAERLATANTL
ncbi:hypothetical protein PV327_003715 [Microctonus hyperodae]|uniref:Death domain-containing protein n=1 Tax=Microctonus hyperodae TaxID=165561 RepID=A0AA39G4I9_MICHY|nr:hypothetical protein PV327_003715 [Microctonus hyperodae]